MASADQMHSLATVIDDVANHCLSTAEQLKTEIGHLKGLKDEVTDLHNGHHAVYDDRSDTGDRTRGYIQGAENDLEEAITSMVVSMDQAYASGQNLHQAAEEIREHAMRILAALGG